MQIKNNFKGFTLVELIVVISIIAILWTVWFVSYSWYTSNARDSKRSSDINTLYTKIDIKVSEWSNLLSIVSSWAIYQLPWTTTYIWWTWVELWANYTAGILNYKLLWLDKDAFIDPSGNDYPIWVTTKIWWAFQLAATLENSSDPIALVKWNYIPRKQTNVLTWIINTDQTKIQVTEWGGIFKKWDWISDTTATYTWEIQNISKNDVLITIDTATALTASTSYGFRLSKDESDWLIAWVASAWPNGAWWGIWPIKNNENGALPYYMK